MVVQELETEIQTLRAGVLEMNRRRDEMQARIRQSEQVIESSRSQILKLLGEASGIRNQIAHEGSAFPLTQAIARKTVQRYGAVFREFGVI